MGQTIPNLVKRLGANYKPFLGPATGAMPYMNRDGYRLLSVREVMDNRINGSIRDHNPWNSISFLTGDAVVKYRDDCFFVLDAAPLTRVNASSITYEQEGLHLSKRDLEEILDGGRTLTLPWRRVQSNYWGGFRKEGNLWVPHPNFEKVWDFLLRGMSYKDAGFQGHIQDIADNAARPNSVRRMGVYSPLMDRFSDDFCITLWPIGIGYSDKGDLGLISAADVGIYQRTLVGIRVPGKSLKATGKESRAPSRTRKESSAQARPISFGYLPNS